jgi:prevent-host-death family protein
MIIPAGQFKAVCLKLMDQVQETREEVIITKRGHPVAKLVPVDAAASRSLFGFIANGVVIHGDIVASTGEPWEADSGHA